MYQAQTIPQQSMQQPGVANPSAPLPPQVPPGWTAHWDQSQQNFYFHNSMTGTVTWDYPHQNALPTSPPGNVHYPPQQQQIQEFDPSATPAPQWWDQQEYSPGADTAADTIGQPQPQHQQQQYGGEECGGGEEYGGEEYGGEEYGGEGYGGKEYGGEEPCGEGYGECAGGGGFDYAGGGFGSMLGGEGDDPVLTDRLIAEKLAHDAMIHDAMITALKNRLYAQSLAHEAMMTGLKNSASYI